MTAPDDGSRSPSATRDLPGSPADLVPVLLLMACAAWVRSLSIAPFIEHWDGLFFVRGVERYSVAGLRPHWPGYPVYMWLGKLMALFVPGTPKAMHLLSVVASTLSLAPVAALAGQWRRALGGDEPEARAAGLAAAVLWAVVPLSWLSGIEIYSDPIALLLALVMLWLCSRTLLHDGRFRAWEPILAAVSGALMVGVRLSYAPFLLLPGVVAWRLRHRRIVLFGRPAPLWLVLCLAGGVTAASWLGWQLAMDGPEILDAGVRHVEGHFGTWGGSIGTDTRLASRPLRLLSRIVIYGVGGWWPRTPLVRLTASVAFLALLANAAQRLRTSSEPRPAVLAALWGVPYGLWILASHDVNLARYSLPLVVLICVLAGIGLPRGQLRAGLATAAALIAVLLVSVPLAVAHQVERPLGLQLAEYLQRRLDPERAFVIFVDRGAIHFAQAYAPEFHVAHASALDEVDRLEAAGWTVYGVWRPGQEPAGWRIAALFARAPFLESRDASELGLYRHCGEPKLSGGGAVCSS